MEAEPHGLVGGDARLKSWAQIDVGHDPAYRLFAAVEFEDEDGYNCGDAVGE